MSTQSGRARSHGRKKVLAIVLAGGEGKRLMPLTADRAKPAVPFAGIYRLIDFALSNVVNAGYLKVVVLTQYKSHSLDRHVTQTWRMSDLLGNYVAPVPAQQRVGKHWYLGSGDAIFQSLNLIRDDKPDIVVVVGADHVYRMDFSQMVAQHVESGAACTVAAIRQPISLADQFGVIDVDPAEPSRIREFLEKPTDPEGLPDSPDEVLASMGNYVFDADALVEAVTDDAVLSGSKHDMGGDIVPAFVRSRRGGRLRLQGQRGARRDRARPRLLARRRDTGVLLRRPHGHRGAAAGVQPLQLRLADLHLLRPAAAGEAGARRARRAAHRRGRRAVARRRGHRRPGLPVGAVALGLRRRPRREVSDSVLLNNVRVGQGAVVRNAIIDKNVEVPPGARVGVDPEEDLARGFVVEDGLTVIGKGQQFPS